MQIAEAAERASVRSCSTLAYAATGLQALPGPFAAMGTSLPTRIVASSRMIGGMKDSTEALRVTYDDVADAAYIYLVPEIEPGGVARSVFAAGGSGPWTVVLDLDPDGRIIGVEVLGAKNALPAALLVE